MYEIRPTFDERDAELLVTWQAARFALRDATPGPLMGDVILFPDGTRERVAHVCSDGVQPSSGQGSHHLNTSGGISYSGALHPSVPLTSLTRIGGDEADIWFFHHNRAGANRGVYAKLRVTVWACDHVPRSVLSSRGLWLMVCRVTGESHRRHRYCISKGGMSQEAFSTRAELDGWMRREGWAAAAPIIDDEAHGSAQLLIKVDDVRHLVRNGGSVEA